MEKLNIIKYSGFIKLNTSLIIEIEKIVLEKFSDENIHNTIQLFQLFLTACSRGNYFDN